jgi:hypothetical protein
MGQFPSNGINVRKLSAIFRKLGGIVEEIPATGEERWGHPVTNRRVRANARRKDAARALVQLVREVLTATVSKSA